jgi:predicted transcriptional regulator
VTGNRKGRKAADQAIIIALAAGRTIEDAAKTSGVSEATVFRRLRRDEFRERITTCQEEFLERSVAVLADGALAAALQLRTLVLNGRTDGIKLQAAKALLEVQLKVRRIVTLEKRIRKLERQEASRTLRIAGQKSS